MAKMTNLIPAHLIICGEPPECWACSHYYENIEECYKKGIKRKPHDKRCEHYDYYLGGV